MAFLEKSFERLRRELIRGIQDAGDQMFTESQRIVNVDRGTLKKSGFIRYLPDGVQFGYRTPYAARVNYGVPRGYSESVRRHLVRAHSVRSHRRNTGTRVIRIKKHVRGPYARGPFTRVFKHGVEGSHYMELSIDSVRPALGQVIARRLRRALT